MNSLIEFNKEINFGKIPIKEISKKTLILTNT